MVEKLKAGQAFEGNGRRTLNLIHVADAADAILQCLEAGPDMREGIQRFGRQSFFKKRDCVLVGRQTWRRSYSFLENDQGGTPDRKVSIAKIKASWLGALVIILLSKATIRY